MRERENECGPLCCCCYRLSECRMHAKECSAVRASMQDFVSACITAHSVGLHDNGLGCDLLRRHNGAIKANGNRVHVSLTVVAANERRTVGGCRVHQHWLDNGAGTALAFALAPSRLGRCGCVCEHSRGCCSGHVVAWVVTRRRRSCRRSLGSGRGSSSSGCGSGGWCWWRCGSGCNSRPPRCLWGLWWRVRGLPFGSTSMVVLRWRLEMRHGAHHGGC